MTPQKRTTIITLIFLTIVSTATLTYAQPSDHKDRQAYAQAVIRKCKEQCSGAESVEWYECCDNLSPKKCKGLIFVGQNGWPACLYSCGGESWWSKTIGRCSP